jgi:hypothetical protein
VTRAHLVAAVTAFVVTLAIVATGALARERPAKMERMAAASGALALSNSAANKAIITAHALMPGQGTTGTITIGNTGEASGLLSLARTAITDVPGAYGGKLSDVLTLQIDDVSGGQAREVFYGEVGGLERIALETLPGGVKRTYRFTVFFPDTGPNGADNAVMGSSVRFDYEWRAEALPVTPTATPTPGTGGGGGTPAPGGGGGGGGGGTETPQPVQGAPIVYLRIPHQRVMHTDAVRLFGRCDSSCTVRFSGRATTAPRKGRRHTLKRRGVFRGEKKGRKLRVTREKAIKLKLSRKGRQVLRRELDTNGRVRVRISARVKGPYGVRIVRKQIVLHTTLIRNGKRINFR